MRIPKGWSQRVIDTCCGPAEAVIHPRGDLGYHLVPWAEDGKVEDQQWYTVTHLPSGSAIANVRTQGRATEVIFLSLSLLPEPTKLPTFSDVKALHTGLSDLYTRWANAAAPKPRPKQAATTKQSRSPEVPLKFSTVWAWNPTPQQRAAALEVTDLMTEASAGDSTSSTTLWSEALPHLFEVTWREEMMVRLASGTQPVILSSDLPAKPPKTLLDGSPVSPATLKRKLGELVALGDRLQQGARLMLRLYAHGSANGWTNALVAKWEALDSQYVALIQEGWMIWSGAAGCYISCSPAVQAKVVEKFGFVGNAEQGYHDLARKTLLRHPEVQEVLPVRRAMKKKIAEEF